MDISICFADFPTQPIAETTRAFRQLGIGYANLGALLMATGHAYDSEGGRSLAAAITSLMTGAAYKRSAELAGVVGPYDGYARNADAHKRVIRKHAAANDDVRTVGGNDAALLKLATRVWQECLQVGDRNGYRNAQASVLAPTGTIGLMMDCDTTGIEPDLALVKFKKLVGGGSMQIVNQTVPRALRCARLPGRAGRGDRRVHRRARARRRRARAAARALRGVRLRDGRPLDRADGPRPDDGRGAAVHLRGDLQDGEHAGDGHRRRGRGDLPAGLEDGPQGAGDLPRQLQGRPAAVRRQDSQGRTGAEKAEKPVEARPVRRRLPKKRPSQTVSFTVGGAEGYLTAGSYPDDGLGEVFIKLGKQGSTLAGVMDAFSIAISVGLQYGIPLESYVAKFTNLRFEPAGMTDDPDVRIATCVMDYLFRRLALDYLPYEKRAELGIFSAEERAAQVSESYGGRRRRPAHRCRRRAATPHTVGAAPAPVEVGSSTELLELRLGKAADAPLCFTCGTKMRPAGSCYLCEGCGSTSGCS